MRYIMWDIDVTCVGRLIISEQNKIYINKLNSELKRWNNKPSYGNSDKRKYTQCMHPYLPKIFVYVIINDLMC
jgi:hypothetical protein